MILLNFDLEEFDLPLEHHVNISLEEQMKYSKEGTRILLDLLKKYQIKVTFFCTAVFAINAKEIVHEIISEGHEIASHGYSHSSVEFVNVLWSKQLLEEISGKAVTGYRMPYMKKIDVQTITDAGYLYDSSINPTFIPGRYNNLNKHRTYFFDKGLLQIPASVSPLARIPLFWLSMHNLPFYLYSYLCLKTLKKDGYLNIYLHPWELSSHLIDKSLRIPFLIRRNSGNRLRMKLEHLVQLFIANGETFYTMSDFIDENNLKTK
jgi:peptidoglycan/xylan/chitin deacetylase (PgdA/CDA1 family)